MEQCDYLFLSSLLSLNMVISITSQMLEKNFSNLEKSFYEYFYDFIKSFNLYAQSSIRSDRQFTQRQDFNIRIYETPVKLTAFYNAFIYEMKQYLNGLYLNETSYKKKEYEFLTCPGVANDMHVLELFKGMSENERFFLVNIPEHQSYDPKNMLIMLGHEIGHFTGTNIRNRELRYKKVINILSKIIVIYIHHALTKCIIEEDNLDLNEEYAYIQNSNLWEYIEKHLIWLLNYYMSDFMIKNFIKEIYVVSKETEGKLELFINKVIAEKYYSDTNKKLIKEVINRIFYKQEELLYDYALEKYFIYWLNKDDKKKADKKKSQMKTKYRSQILDFLVPSVWNKEKLYIFSSIDFLFHLLKECVSDLIVILTLRLSMKEYLEVIINNLENIGIHSKNNGELPLEFETKFKEKFDSSIISLRIGLVTHCMLEQMGVSDFVWDDNDLINIPNNRNLIITWIKYYTVNFQECFKENKLKVEKIEKPIHVLYDKGILIEIMEYLNKCKNTFYEANKINDNDNKRKNLAKACDIFNTDANIEDVVLKLQGYIETYSKNIQEVIKTKAMNYQGRGESE